MSSENGWNGAPTLSDVAEGDTDRGPYQWMGAPEESDTAVSLAGHVDIGREQDGVGFGVMTGQVVEMGVAAASAPLLALVEESVNVSALFANRLTTRSIKPPCGRLMALGWTPHWSRTTNWPGTPSSDAMAPTAEIVNNAAANRFAARDAAPATLLTKCLPGRDKRRLGPGRPLIFAPK